MPEEKYSISSDEQATGTPQDYFFLRRKAIEILEKINNPAWTDFNLHDPGITIIEQLCFAITDLAYRTNFDIKDLLTNETGEINNKAHAFYPAHEILSIHPYTANDFCKFIVDSFEEIENAWIEPEVDKVFLDGVMEIFNITVCPSREMLEQLNNDNMPESGKENSEESAFKIFATKLEERIRAKLNTNRNINQRFEKILILEPRYISIKANVSIEKFVDAEKMLADFFQLIEKNLNPHPVFYTADELTNKLQKTIEQIYDGPALVNGIMLQENFKEKKKLIEAEEMIEKISGLTGVIRVSEFSFISDDKKQASSSLKIDKNEFILLKKRNGVFEHSNISVHVNKFKVSISEEILYLYCMQNQQAAVRNFREGRNLVKKEESSAGIYRELSKYYSIQDFFPATYLIGKDGIMSSDTNLRKAQANQLKAYLLFFEQILANYLAQLANLDKLYSPVDKLSPLNKTEIKTYFSQPLYDVPGIKDIIFKEQTDEDQRETAWKEFKKDISERNKYFTNIQNQIESEEIALTRKNAMLTHILARFNLVADTYPVELQASMQVDKNTFDRQKYTEIEWKSAMVKNILSHTKFRAKAYNYLIKGDETPCFHKIVYDILNITTMPTGSLTSFLGGYFEIEETVSNNLEAIGKPVKKNYEFDSDEMASLFVGNEMFEAVVDDFFSEYKERPVNGSLSFEQADISIFSDACKINFFKIAPSFNNFQDAFAVIYKNKWEEKWRIAGKFETKKLAHEAILKASNYFAFVNLSSEGFHLVEHILLCPPLNTEKFGFKLIDLKENLVLKNKRWLTYEQRRERVLKINNILKEDTGITDVIDEALEDISELYYDKPLIGNRYRWEYFFTLDCRESYSEKCLSNTISVVYPNWPSRFQDEKFIEYMKKIINEHSPAHVKVNFISLDINSMQNFEEYYFKWLKELREKDLVDKGNKAAPDLINFILKHSDKKQDDI